MKKITRADLRGKPLDKDCHKAYRSTHEYGIEDNRVYCLGLIDCMNDELLEKCRDCNAHVTNVTPLRKRRKGVIQNESI